MATKPQDDADDFDAAFASFANPNAAPAGPDDQPVDSGAAGDPADLDADGGDGATPVADGAGAADPAGGGDPDPDGEPAADQVVAAPQAADPQTDALIARLAGLVKDAPAAAPSPATAPVAPADIYDDEEKQFLSTYDNDWADVIKGEALKRRAEHRDLVSFVFQQVAAQLRPVFETVDVLSTRTHLADLRDQVEDYDTVRDNVISWVDTQPTYLQSGMKGVIQSGSADEVADLINRYRQATGAVVKPVTTPTPTKSVELSSDAKKAAEALAPVNTKRSVVPADDDTDDFDAAFKRWATTDKKQ